jgi:hypothetical protein
MSECQVEALAGSPDVEASKATDKISANEPIVLVMGYIW